MLTRRLQVLLDEERYARLAARAEERQTSIAALVREAVDARFPSVEPGRRAAAGRILAAASMPVPQSPHDLKQEIADTRSRLA